MMKLLVTLALVAGADAQTELKCMAGALSQNSKDCQQISSSDGGGFTWDCTVEGTTCLTAKYEGDWLAAYGCIPDSSLALTKLAIQQACAADPDCNKWNPGGVPADGYTECKTDNCNECNSGFSFRPSSLLLA